MAFNRLDSARPIEELVLAFDPHQIEERVRQRRRRMRSRVVSLVITVIILAVLYYWQREQLGGTGFVALYAVLLGVSVGWLLVSVLRFVRAKRELARMGQGTALRIGRQGVELGGTFVAWSDVQSLAVAKGKLGRSPVLRVVRTPGAPLDLPLDQIDVRPATLDLTARAYSAGRHGVDLDALDA